MDILWSLALLIAVCIVVSLVATVLIFRLEFRPAAGLVMPVLAGVGVSLWLFHGRHYWWAIFALISALLSIRTVMGWLAPARVSGRHDEG